MSKERVCAECGVTKPIAEYGSRTKTTGSRSVRCHTCRAARPREDRTEWQKDYGRRWTLMKKYGMTLEDYERLSSIQGGVCLICEQPETRIGPTSGTVQPLVVDHNHATGQVRGLLCCRCNRLLGMVSDDPMHLRRAAAYLDLRPAFLEAIVVIPEDMTAPYPIEVEAGDPS